MERSNTRGQSTGPSNSLVQIMRRYPLFFFFLIVLGLTWLYELIVYGILHLPEFSIGRAFILGPTLAAFIMTSVTEGRTGVLRLLRRYVLWRVGIPWYLFVLLGIPALVLLGFFVLPGAVAAFRAPAPAFVLSYFQWYIVIFFGVSLFEEPGWRGFALPRLQQRSGPLVGTLLLGVLWAFWHLPLLLFVPGYDRAGTGFVGIMIPFVGLIIGTVALAVIITWVFNNARGSLLLVMLLHTSYDTALVTVLPKLFPSLPATPLINFLVNLNIAFVVVALLIIATTRGRLSYQRYLRETALPAPGTDQVQKPGTAGTAL